jgi:hypothetical protein
MAVQLAASQEGLSSKKLVHVKGYLSADLVQIWYCAAETRRIDMISSEENIPDFNPFFPNDSRTVFVNRHDAEAAETAPRRSQFQARSA